MKKKVLLYNLLVLIFPVALHAQISKPLFTDNKLQTNIDSAIHVAAGIYMQDSNANGISIGMYKNGKAYRYNYGEVKKGSGKLPSADNYYNIGSVAKTFVTTLLAQAVIEKKVSLTDDIRKFLPGKYPNLEYDGHPIRFIDLANHTSGIPNALRTYSTAIRDSLRKLSMAGQVNFYSRYNEDSILEDLHGMKMDTMPGVEYRYNSNGMMILILLLERIYHQPYEQLITHYLTTHLGMYDTKTELSFAEIKRAAQGYNNRGQPQEFLNLKGFFIGPTINSTVNDMLKYIQANLSEKDKAIKLTHQITWGKKDGFALGLGWMLDNDSKGERYIYHDGNTKIGFNTLCTLYPDEDLGLIIIVNDTIGQDKVGDLENQIKTALDNLWLK